MQNVNYIIMYLGDLRFDEVCVIGGENVVFCMFSFWLSLLYVMLMRVKMVHLVHLLCCPYSLDM